MTTEVLVTGCVWAVIIATTASVCLFILTVAAVKMWKYIQRHS